LRGELSLAAMFHVKHRSHPASPEDLADDRARALTLTPVSRETLERLHRFVALLLTWQQRINLIAPSTIPELWTRHVADSLQLLALAPEARTWVDLGSGGGFPGLVLACALAERPGAVIHLVESNAKKAAFLHEARRLTDVPAVVHAERIEQFVRAFSTPADALTARALAPLNRLLDQGFLLLARTGTVGLFPKGQDVERELGEARRNWDINVNIVPSRTDPAGRIVVVRELARRRTAP
jgi:16S rRNA (guanine527-N7)-methyltransferase